MVAAVMISQGNEYSPGKSEMPTGAVRMKLSLIKTSESGNSFQEKMKTISPVEIKPGAESGKMMLQKMRRLLAPSTLAASSISCGTVLKKLVRIQMAIGV